MSPSQAWVDTDKVPKELRSIKKFLQEFIYDVDENSSQIAIYKFFEEKKANCEMLLLESVILQKIACFKQFN